MFHCHNFENKVLVVPQHFVTPFYMAPFATGKRAVMWGKTLAFPFPHHPTQRIYSFWNKLQENIAGHYRCRAQTLRNLARPKYQILSTETEEEGTTQLPSPRLSEGFKKVDQGMGDMEKHISSQLHPSYPWPDSCSIHWCVCFRDKRKTSILRGQQCFSQCSPTAGLWHIPDAVRAGKGYCCLSSFMT